MPDWITNPGTRLVFDLVLALLLMLVMALQYISKMNFAKWASLQRQLHDESQRHRARLEARIEQLEEPYG